MKGNAFLTKKTKNMKDFIIGIILLLIITVAVWYLHTLFPIYQFSMLEVWGIISAILLLKGAKDTYNEEILNQITE